MSGSIAGNHMSLPYRVTPAEGVVLHNHGIDRVAQLFGVNDLNGCIDVNTNGSEVEGGLFVEEFVTRYSRLFPFPLFPPVIFSAFQHDFRGIGACL